MRRKITNKVLYFAGVITVAYTFPQIEKSWFNVNGEMLGNKFIVLASLNDVNIVRNFVALVLIIIGIVTLRVVFNPNRTKSIEYISDFQKEFRNEIKEVGFTSKISFSVLFIVATVFLLVMIMPSFISDAINDKSLILNLVLFVAPMSLAEEVIFRYGIFKYIRQMHVNVIISYLISAIIFGLGHFYKNNGLPPVLSVVWVSAFGILLQMVYEGSGWSIYPSWGFHTLNNVAAILISIPRK